MRGAAATVTSALGGGGSDISRVYHGVWTGSLAPVALGRLVSPPMSSPRVSRTDAAESSGRRIAVIGVRGFVGGALLRRLEDDRGPERLVALDLKKPLAPLDRSQFYRVDVTLPSADGDLADILAREEIDTVVHAAFLGNPTHRTAWAHELEDVGTMHILAACARARVAKVVLASTTLVYGAAPGHPNLLVEDRELSSDPRVPFVATKVAAERQVRKFRAAHPEICVTTLRLAALLGPKADSLAARFLSRPVAPVLLGFDPLLQVVHEEDAIDALLLALTGDHPGEFNIVADGVLPYTTLLALLGRLPLPLPRAVAYPLVNALHALQLVSSPSAMLDWLRYLCVADGTKAREVLGFEPRYDLRATLADFLGLPVGGAEYAVGEGRA
ncbi:MAG: NAD-dependent epimerase/dehydratase family protein [Myxococcales bacterium]|nr:NAD-dependent epimerase/dehydratase family protein [Myxococcales bacterium]